MSSIYTTPPPHDHASTHRLQHTNNPFQYDQSERLLPTCLPVTHRFVTIYGTTLRLPTPELRQASQSRHTHLVGILVTLLISDSFFFLQSPLIVILSQHSSTQPSACIHGTQWAPAYITAPQLHEKNTYHFPCNTEMSKDLTLQKGLPRHSHLQMLPACTPCHPAQARSDIKSNCVQQAAMSCRCNMLASRLVS